ncbi:hypothetical protein AHAS_Ahas07G0074400 [Arachis hypogaea]
MDDTLCIILQEQREFLKRQEATIASFAEAISQLAPPPNNNQLTSQPSSSSALPSQPLPNPKGSLNAIYLRSVTTLEERSPKELREKKTTLDEDVVEVEDVEDKEEVQEVIEEEVIQVRESGSKEEDVLKEVIPIPFSSLAKRTENSISALMGAIPENYGDPGPCLVSYTINGVQFVDCMCDLGACVSIMPLFVYDALNLQLLKFCGSFCFADKSIISVADTYSFEIDERAISFKLDEAIKHPLEDHSIFRCDMIDEVVAEIHHETLYEINMSKGLSVGKDEECEVIEPEEANGEFGEIDPEADSIINEFLFTLTNPFNDLHEPSSIEFEGDVDVDFTQSPKFDLSDDDEDLEEVDEEKLQNVYEEKLNYQEVNVLMQEQIEWVTISPMSLETDYQLQVLLGVLNGEALDIGWNRDLKFIKETKPRLGVQM